MAGRFHSFAGAARCAALALTLASPLPLAAPPALAAKVPEIFPEYAQRKGSLGRVVLLADVVAIRQEGGTPVVRMARGRAYADTLMPLVRDILIRQGLQVDTTLFASMGIVFDEERGYRVAESDTGAAGAMLANPPFFVDSLLTSIPEGQKRWKELNRTLRSYVRKKKDAASSLGPAVALGKALDAGGIAVLRVSTWDVPIGKQLSSLFGTGPAQKSASFLGLTILAAEDGMILWDDWSQAPASLKPEDLRERILSFERSFP